MRALVAVAALAAVASLASLASGAPSPRPVGFDHRRHDRELVVGGGDSIACERCHPQRAGRLVGKPGHAACFGACHGPPPRGDKPGDRLAVCTTCHAEATLVAPGTRFAVPYPPYTLDRDFAITVGHRRHRDVACAHCHAGKPAPHARCAGCHDGSGAPGRGPAMSACAGCHPPAAGTPLPPSIVPAELNVAGAFSHTRHAARGGDGARCTTCHQAVLATDDNALPAPAAATCAAGHCHDGASAFALTASCTRCHRAPNVSELRVERPTARYSHAIHATVHLSCGACHPLTSRGEVTVSGHGPCVPCHADDFGLRKPTICGACHNGTEPWRMLVADRGPPERTEFGATLDHTRHPGPCTSCHALTTPTAELRPPRGHRACTTQGCHATASGPAPRLGACEGCHRQGLALGRQIARLAAPWSVRRAFDHASHAGPDGALACGRCHIDVRAPDVTALATPPKATCAPCHDGTTAFKLTGTTCKRCHQGAP